MSLDVEGRCEWTSERFEHQALRKIVPSSSMVHSVLCEALQERLEVATIPYSSQSMILLFHQCLICVHVCFAADCPRPISRLKIMLHSDCPIGVPGQGREVVARTVTR